jgi:hypothetical protein
MILITTYYRDNNKIRQLEFEYVLGNNIENPLIKKIILLCEQPPNTELSNKVSVINVGKRLKFKEVIVFANKLDINEIKIICNSDIFFNGSLVHLDSKLDCKLIYCLTRWDYIEESNPVFYENFKSQDAWIFKGKLPENIGNYYMGLPGCDNRLAKEFIDSDFKILNPSLTIRAIHVHGSNLRNYHKKTDRVMGEYAYPLPIELENHETLWGQKKEYALRLKYLHGKWRNNLEGVNCTFLERIFSKISILYLKYLKI